MVEKDILKDEIIAARVRKDFDNVVKHIKQTTPQFEIDKCIQCGYCRNTSATYQMSKRESDSHPGRMFILKNFNNEDTQAEVLLRLYHMTMAGRAETICPANIRHEFAFTELRKKYFPLAIRSGQFPNMEKAINNLKDRGKENPEGKRKEKKFDWLSEIEHRRSDYLYFVGSNDLLNNHDKVRKVLWLLNKFDIPYTISRYETDSGHLAQVLGDEDTAAHYNDRIKNLVEDMGFKKIIVSCPHELDRLRSVFSDSKVEIIHIMEIIYNKLRNMGSKRIHKLNAKVAYLDPCYLTKHYPMDIPRKILQDLGLEIVEKTHAKEESYCCGHGGGFSLNFPDEAKRIATTHLNETEDVKADYLVTNCSFCNSLVGSAKKKANSKTKVIDLIDLVVKSIKWAL